MRSLTVKLTLAFLLIGAIGASLVAVLVGLRTRTEFDRFVSQRDQDALVQALTGYYSSHSGWAGVDDMLANTPPLNFYSRSMKLIDPAGTVLLDSGKTGSAVELPPDLVKTKASSPPPPSCAGATRSFARPTRAFPSSTRRAPSSSCRSRSSSTC